MLELTQKTLNSIKKVLLREQKKVEADLKTVQKDDPAKAPTLAESSEPGTESWIAEQHGRAVAVGTQLKNTAQNVKKALLKIRKGAYGKCEKCGKYIGTGRLLAMPVAQFCVSCSQKSNETKNNL